MVDCFAGGGDGGIRKSSHVAQGQVIRKWLGDFPGGPVAKTLWSQCRGPGLHPWSGNEIPQATTKSLNDKTRDLACHN